MLSQSIWFEGRRQMSKQPIKTQRGQNYGGGHPQEVPNLVGATREDTDTETERLRC